MLQREAQAQVPPGQMGRWVGERGVPGPCREPAVLSPGDRAGPVSAPLGDGRPVTEGHTEPPRELRVWGVGTRGPRPPQLPSPEATQDGRRPCRSQDGAHRHWCTGPGRPPHSRCSAPPPDGARRRPSEPRWRVLGCPGADSGPARPPRPAKGPLSGTGPPGPWPVRPGLCRLWPPFLLRWLRSRAEGIWAPLPAGRERKAPKSTPGSVALSSGARHGAGAAKPGSPRQGAGGRGRASRIPREPACWVRTHGDGAQSVNLGGVPRGPGRRPQPWGLRRRRTRAGHPTGPTLGRPHGRVLEGLLGPLGRTPRLRAPPGPRVPTLSGTRASPRV